MTLTCHPAIAWLEEKFDYTWNESEPDISDDIDDLFGRDPITTEYTLRFRPVGAEFVSIKDDVGTNEVRTMLISQSMIFPPPCPRDGVISDTFVLQDRARIGFDDAIRSLYPSPGERVTVHFDNRAHTFRVEEVVSGTDDSVLIRFSNDL